MENATGQHCPQSRLEEALRLLGADEMRGMTEVERLRLAFPGDARLHFLEGSLLAGMKRYPEAHEAMERAVALAPGFAIARFQLGFLQFTSGDASAAAGTWAPLVATAPENDPLRLFAEGLTRLGADDFDGASELLRKGIAGNADNPALNSDMALLLDEIGRQRPPPASSEPGLDEEPMSLAQLALQQSAARSTRH